ncbi:MAG: efflux RND transporter periplasmic adaptor subunit [bacterium]
MTKKKKLLLIIGGGVLLVVIVVLNLTMSTSHSTSVQAETTRMRDIVETVSASGRIQPQTKVDITSEINGEIIGLYAREGDQVQSGNLLVVLDTVQLRSDVDQARYAVNEINARLEGAETQLGQAREEFERQQRLFEGNLTSETVFNNANYSYLNTKSTFEATKAQAQQFQARYEKQLDYLSKAKIVAPMSGIITYVDCEVGEIAAAQTAFTQGKTLLTIANLDVFEVEVEVDETEITKIELSQEAEIEVDAFPDTTFPGEVVEIGNTAILSGLGSQDQSTNFRVKVIFKDPNVKIRPGMSATVDITTAHRDKALSIPYSAVVVRSFNLDSLERARTAEETADSSPGVSEVHAAEQSEEDTVTFDEETEREELKGVFVIREGKVSFVEIETGVADQKNIEVTSGLTEGDSVVSGPYRVLRTIKDDDDVTIIKKHGGNQ